MRHKMKRCFHFLLCLVCTIALSRTAGAEERLWLVRGGKPCAIIVAGADDAYAAGRLQRGIAERCKLQLPIRSPQEAAPDGQCSILVGSAASNPAVAALAASLGIDMDAKRLTQQGYVARWFEHQGRPTLLLAGGGRDGTLYAVVDLLNWHLEGHASDVWLGKLDTRQVPRYPYRWFWNWDHRMDWGGPGRVGNLMGGGGRYSKQPEAYTIDCHRCIDFMADHKFNGLIMWGFLRDTHGGVPVTQEICRYATERGVRILPGVGTSDYGGYYFEGRHEFNVDTYLAAHPERRAIGPNGKPRNAICPSQKVNQDWLDRGAEWLFANFQVGGVNLEMGDFYVCYCDGCKQARAAIPSNEPDYYKDMAISHMVTLRKLRQLKPDAWLSYATYTGYTAEMMRQPPQFLRMIPDDAICQWTLTGMARHWQPEVRPMARHNVGYLHWCNSSTHTQDDFYLQEIQAICQQAAGVGFEGLDTYGELSDELPNAEIFYLAWEAFLWQPEMSIEEFVDRRLGRLYGGSAAARRLLEVFALVRRKAQRESMENCEKAIALARLAREGASPEGQPRWYRLIARLDRHRVAAEEQIRQRRQQEQAAREGEKVAVAAVKASDEDRARKWTAQRAIDGDVTEPAGYWLTRRDTPKSAWLELTLAQPSRVNRVVLFHQLDPAHYRSLDYTVSIRQDGQWKSVLRVRNNQQAGWVAHSIPEVLTDAVRLEITRSAYGGRMGVGEIELRYVPGKRQK